MKKLYTLLLVAIAFSANAQLITNGGFENWTAGVPDGFTITVPANGGSVAQETTDFKSGASSAKFTAPTGTGTLKAAQADIAIIGSHSYTLTYWYKDETDGAKFRHWGAWRDATAAITDASLQPSLYNVNTSGWQQVTVTATAPAAATLLRLDFRAYQDVTGGGIVFLDDISLTDNGLGVKQNSISGLRVYPNPVVDGNLFITSDSNETKSVVVFDVLGKQVLKTVVTNQPINISGLNSGVYIVKITEDGKTATRKLVIR